MSKNITLGEDARHKLKQGIEKLAEAVKTTLGASGECVMISTFGGHPPVITKDGVSVAKAIDLPDPIENMACSTLKEVAIKTNEEAGDGTTTSIVLAQAFFEQGITEIENGAKPIEVQRRIDKQVALILDELDKMKEDIAPDSEKLIEIASISANNDREIGEIIAEAYSRIGKNSYITVEKSKTPQTSVEYVAGLQFDRGWESMYFCPINSEVVEFENPYIIITDSKFNNFKAINNLLVELSTENRPFVFLCDAMEQPAIQTLVENKFSGALQPVVVKAPEFGDRRDAMLEDIAVLTGGKYFNSATDDISEITLKDLGEAKKVIVTKEKTTIIEGVGAEEDIAKRVEMIEAQAKESTELFEKNILTQRIAKLQGGMANMKVGANSDVEMKEKMDRVEDALNSSKAALEEGIVIGGGMALFRIAQKLLANKKIDQMMYDVLITPLSTIIENSGESAGGIIEDMDENAEKLGINKNSIGYDAKSNTYADLVSIGVVDPVKVTKEALKAASSVAGTLLTTNCTINEIDDSILNPMATM